MGATHFAGPLLVGDLTTGQPNGPNQGWVVLERTFPINTTAAGTFESGIYIPAGSRILDIIVDVLTAFTNATSSTLNIGTGANPTLYHGPVNMKTAGRVTATNTSTPAQLAAMNGVTVAGVPSPTIAPLNAQLVNVGAGGAGFALVNVRYAMLASTQ